MKRNKEVVAKNYNIKSWVKSNPLFLVFAIPVCGDVIGTVLGQPAAYWTSHFQIVNEAAPVYPLLQIHPLVFIIVVLVGWLSFTYFLTKKLPHSHNLWAAMALFAGHAYNSVNWLRIIQRNHMILNSGGRLVVALSLIPMIVYILVIGLVAARALDIYFSVRKNN